MILKNKENEKYVKLGITLAAVAVVALIFYFVCSSLSQFSAALSAVSAILAPFIYGAVIAYLVAPLCRKLEQKFKALFKGKRDKLAGTLAMTVSMLVTVAIVLAVLLLLVPQVIHSVTGLLKVLPSQVEKTWNTLDEWLKSQPELAEQWGKYGEEIENRINLWLKNGMPDTAKVVLSGAIGGVYDTVTVLKNILLGLFVSIYILARRRQLAAQARLLITGIFKSPVTDWIEKETRFMDRMFNGFFTGKLLDSAIVGVLCFAGCLVMGFQSSLLIAVIVGVTNIIPFFGPFIGAIPCALLLLLQNPMHCLMFLIFILVLQQLDGNVIGPRILGNTTGLPGIWVMFAILLFGGLWGIGGMIIGVPLMAVIYDIVRQLTYFGIRRHGRNEMIENYNAAFHPPTESVKKKGK